MLGDFYFQPNIMAENKVKLKTLKGRSWFLWHGIIYAIVMAVIFACAPCIQALWPWLIIFLSHFAIDFWKIYMESEKRKKKKIKKLKKKLEQKSENKSIRKKIQKLETKIKKEIEKEPEQESKKKSIQEKIQELKEKLEQESEKESIGEKIQKLEKELEKESEKEAEKESKQESIREDIRELEKESEKESEKEPIQKKIKELEKGPKGKWLYFVIDQILHISIIVGCYWIFLQSNPGLLQQQMIYVLPQFKTALVYATIILIVIKPASLFVACVFESKFFVSEKLEEPMNPGMAEDQKQGTENAQHPIPGAGKWIGIMERLIVVALVLLNATGAIGFVLTAKSIARYTQIAEKQVTAESYLIGTLLSVGIALGAVFVIPLLCP